MFSARSASNVMKSLRASVRAEIPQSDPWIFPNNLYVVLKVIAQAIRGVELRLQWLQRQAFVSLADGDQLDRHGSEIGIVRLSASQAAGNISVVSTGNPTIPSGTRMLRSDGIVFVTVSTIAILGSPELIAIRAYDPGKQGNTDPGTALTLENVIAGITSIAVDDSGITGGAETENDANLRGRILFKKRNPPHGGSPSEYYSWCKEIAGVTRIWTRRATPVAGAVTVFFMMDDTYSDGIPLPGDINTLQYHLYLRAPENASIVVKAPAKVLVNVTVTNLLPISAKVRSEVQNEIVAMFRRRAQPGSIAVPFRFSLSWISEAISNATGEFSHQLTAPVADVICTEDGSGNNQIAVPGVITFD